MTESVPGVIARGKGAPVEVATILVPEPGPGEALVRIQACGVCHTDRVPRPGERSQADNNREPNEEPLCRPS